MDKRYSLIDPQNFSETVGFRTTAEDPSGGTLPLWLDKGQPSYLDPRARGIGLAGDWIARSKAASRTSDWFNFLGMARVGFDAATELQANTQAPNQPDWTVDDGWKTLDPNTRDILERYGYNIETFRKAAKNPSQFSEIAAEAIDRVETDQTWQYFDEQATTIGYGATKIISGLVNYVITDPTTYLTLGLGPVMKAAGVAQKASVASILAGSAGLGAAASLEGWNSESRQLLKLGVIDDEDIDLSNAATATFLGAGFGLALGSIPASIHYHKYGWAPKAPAAIIDAPKNPADLAKLNDYNLTRQAFVATAKQRFGEDAGRYRYVLSREVMGMEEAEHASFLKSLTDFVREKRPTEAEFRNALDPNGVNSRFDIENITNRRYAETVKDFDIERNPVRLTRQILANRYKDKAEKFAWLADDRTIKTLGFKDQNEVVDWLQTAETSDIMSLMKIRSASDAFNARLNELDTMLAQVQSKQATANYYSTLRAEAAQRNWEKVVTSLDEQYEKYVNELADTAIRDKINRFAFPADKGKFAKLKKEIESLRTMLFDRRMKKLDRTVSVRDPVDRGSFFQWIQKPDGRMTVGNLPIWSTDLRSPREFRSRPAPPPSAQIRDIPGPANVETPASLIGKPENIRATKKAEQLWELEQAQSQLRNTVARIQSILDDADYTGDRAALRKLQKSKQTKLAQAERKIGSIKSQIESERALGARPNLSPGLARQADAIRQKIQRLRTQDPTANADEIRSLEARLRGIEVRQTTPPTVEAPRPRSGVSLQTRFVGLVDKANTLRTQIGSLAQAAGNNPTPTQRRILSTLSDNLASLKKQLRREFSYDIDNPTLNLARATERPAVASGSSTPISTPPDAPTAIRAFLDRQEKSGLSYSVARGLTVFSTMSDLPVLRQVTSLARRALFSRTGQERVLFNQSSETLRFWGQTVANEHIREVDLMRTGKPVQSMFLQKHVTEGKAQRQVVVPILEAVRKTGLSEEDLSRRVADIFNTGVLSGDATIDDLYKRIKTYYDEYGRKGEANGTLGKLREKYLPRFWNVNTIAADAKKFTDDLTQALVNRWSKSLEINRVVAKEVGWLQEVDGKLVVTEKGTLAGIGEKWPELNALTPEAQDAYRAAMPDALRKQAIQSREKILGNTTIEHTEMVDPDIIRSNGAVINSKSRQFDDEIVKDPVLEQYLEKSLFQSIYRYATSTALRIDINQMLKDMVGFNTTFDEFHTEVSKKVIEASDLIGDNKIKVQNLAALESIRNKYNSIFGRRPMAFTNSNVMGSLAETGVNVGRTFYGGRWALQSMTSELLGQVVQAIPEQDLKVLSAVFRNIGRNKIDKAKAMADAGYALDMWQLSMRYAVSPLSETAEANTGWLARIRAPWHQALNVARGIDAPLSDTPPGMLGRVLDTTVAATRASANTSLELGGFQWATSIARLTKANTVKRYIIDNLDTLETLRKQIDEFKINEMSPADRIKVWQKLSEKNVLYWDNILRMNSAGLLEEDVLKAMQNVAKKNNLKGGFGDWHFDELEIDPEDLEVWRTKVEPRLTYYMTEQLDLQVYTPRPWTRNTDSVHWIDILYDALQGFARAFGARLGYTGPTQMTLTRTAYTAFSFFVGSAIYRSLIDVMENKVTWEEMERRWEEEPSRMLFVAAADVPMLGVFSALGMNVIGQMTGLSYNRGAQGAFGSTPVSSLMNQMSRGVFEAYEAVSEDNPDIDTNKFIPFMNLIPGYGVWWFQSGLSAAGLNPRTPKD